MTAARTSKASGKSANAKSKTKAKSNASASTAVRTDPELWTRTVARVKRGAKGGKPGQWSARKAQLAVAEYKRSGGGYRGPKRASSNSLARWTRQNWRTKSGRPSVVGARPTGERYLPEKALRALSAAEYAATTRKKRAALRQGKQFSRQPAKIASKTRRFRSRRT